MTNVKISGLSINMENMIEVVGKRFRILYGSAFIILGIAIGIVTYMYVFPIGSIMLILSGLILIFWKRRNRMIHGVMSRVIGKEIR